jgi:hypothetical protein
MTSIVFSILIFLSIMAMPVSSQPEVESAHGSMNRRERLLDDGSFLEALPLQVDGSRLMEEDDTTVTAFMAKEAKQEF